MLLNWGYRSVLIWMQNIQHFHFFGAKIQTSKIAKNHHYSLPQMLKTSAVQLSLSHGSKGGSIDPFCGLALSFFTTSVLIIMSHLLSIVWLQNHCKAKPSKKDNGSINRRIDDLRKVKLRGFWLPFWLTCKSILNNARKKTCLFNAIIWNFILCQHIWY